VSEEHDIVKADMKSCSLSSEVET